MKRDIQVHCLPTEKASHISQNATGKWYWDDVTYGTSPNFQPYYLYATIDEQPKEGDWVIIRDKVLRQNIHGVIGSVIGTDEYLKKHCRKVVATTDEGLHKQVLSSNGRVLMAETQYPQISPEFQQAWVKAANEGNPIVDAVMEFDRHIENAKVFLEEPHLNDKGYVTILPIKEKMYTNQQMEDALVKHYIDIGSTKGCNLGQDVRIWTKQWIEQNL